MESTLRTLRISTEQKQELIDVTSAVAGAVRESGVQHGFVGVYSQHTTAALFVSERQAALMDDVLAFMSRVVPDGLAYKHNSPEFSDCDRQNAASHLRSLLLNHSVMVPVVEGKPALGVFQSILLAEFDGPRQRTLQVQVLGNAL